MKANDYQVGGNHYEGDYQVWDFIIDVKLNFILGTAIKYLDRFSKKKNEGVEGLEKAIHYIVKAEERSIFHTHIGRHDLLLVYNADYINYFDNLDGRVKAIIGLIIHNNFKTAKARITQLIKYNSKSVD